ncbi:hypothetical protein BDW66DRAFT_108106 [Aspergillus desertorum]
MHWAVHREDVSRTSADVATSKAEIAFGAKVMRQGNGLLVLFILMQLFFSSYG